jgi:hypothetical protein
MQSLDVVSTFVYDQEKDRIRDMIGIQVSFRSPYYLFFCIEDLTDEKEDNVYFVGYEMKSPGPAFWGYMDKENYKITIFGSCWYRTNLLNNMVKQWKKNNLKYVGASIQNKVYPRTTYLLNDLDKKYNMTFGEFDDEKYIASYFRGEIDKKDLPKDLDKKKLDIFLKRMEEMNRNEKITQLKKIDKKNDYVTLENYMVPVILSIPDYERYKAFHALLTNKINLKQFHKVFPWKYTLDVLDSLMYDFFETSPEIGVNDYFWNLYEEDTQDFLGELYKQILIYEKNMNRIDEVNQFFKKLINEFFNQLQTRKIKIRPSENCPELIDCISDGRPIDKKSCMVYEYPDGYKTGNIK